jgi:hypothetical protein
MTLIVNCADVGFPDMFIRTTDEEVQMTLHLLKNDKQQAKTVMVAALIHLTHIKRTGTLDHIYTDTNRKTWQDFCDDIVVFYIARYVLYGKQIPLVSQPPPVANIQHQREQRGRGRPKKQ